MIPIKDLWLRMWTGKKRLVSYLPSRHEDGADEEEPAASRVPAEPNTSNTGSLRPHALVA